ncbi:MAG: ECF-type sigma factor [Planctomycetota bacterium]
MNGRASDNGELAPGPLGADHLIELVYDDLRRLAVGWMGKAQWTVQPTALVHEAYARCARSAEFRDRSHFAAVAAKAMRQLLVDHARRRRAGRRDVERRTEIDVETLGREACDVLVIDDALGSLAGLDGRKARVVELRVFGGLTIEQTATALGVSHMTVSNDWRFARAWLADRLGR